MVVMLRVRRMSDAATSLTTEGLCLSSKSVMIDLHKFLTFQIMDIEVILLTPCGILTFNLYNTPEKLAS